MTKHLLCFFLVFLAVAPLATAQPGEEATVRGVVLSNETEQPLAGAHVFLAGTMIGTTTDARGRYLLEHVPPGAYRLYVSMLGYDEAQHDLLVTGTVLPSFTFRLVPTIIQLDEVVVESGGTRSRRRQLRKFRRHFIGETPNAEQTEILNPEVLSFEDQEDVFTVYASAPLLLENAALGYRIRYFLADFVVSHGETHFTGEPLFEALIPESPSQADRWRENRETAYYGSFRHFMVSLLADDLSGNAFAIEAIGEADVPTEEEVEEGISTPNKVLVLRDSIPSDIFSLQDTNNPTIKEVRFAPSWSAEMTYDPIIEVTYRREAEEEAFLNWRGNPFRYHGEAPAYQRSLLEMKGESLQVDPMGSITSFGGYFVRHGYFAFERAGDQLPKEYQPERYP